MFNNLEAEMARCRINRKKLAELTGISYKSLKSKMTGAPAFKVNEMITIKNAMNALKGDMGLPGDEYTLDYLFETYDKPA